LVSGEFRDRGLCVLGTVESDHTGSTRATIWLILDFRLFDLTNSGEQLNEILVAGRPRKLKESLAEYAAHGAFALTLRT
jgi:hypothetical protein